jgi:hypothetical protein
LEVDPKKFRPVLVKTDARIGLQQILVLIFLAQPFGPDA